MGTILVATEDEVFKKGLYGVRLQAIEEKSAAQTEPDGTVKQGTYLRWTFDILKRGFEGKILRGNSSTAFGPSAKGRKWAEALLDRQLHVNEPVDTDDLVGLTAIATVGIVKKGEKTYNEIEALTPVDDEEQKRPAPTQERPQKPQEARNREAAPRRQLDDYPTDQGDEVLEF